MSYLWKVSFVMVFMASHALASFSDEVDCFLQENNYSGTILLAKDEQIYLEKAYGYANRAQKKRNTTDTIYPIASIAK